MHACLVELVCRKDPLAKIAACKGEYDNVAVELTDLCDGSTLGKLLFEALTSQEHDEESDGPHRGGHPHHDAFQAGHQP